MSSENSIKRFVAGAVCPRCAEMDKLKVHHNALNQQVRECVFCGYQDVMTDQGPQEITSEEIKTRVNQVRPGEQGLVHEDEIQVVNIIDPQSKRKEHLH